MLKSIRSPEVSDDDYAYAWLRSWVAIDQENGAYLMQSNGRGKYGNVVFWLIVKEPVMNLHALANVDYTYRQRFTINPWETTLDGAVEIANEYLAKWLEKQEPK